MLLAAVLLLLGAQLLQAQNTVHLVSTRQNWQNAENYCVARGGHLVSVHNAFQANSLSGLARNTDCQFYYSGGKCTNGQCSWTDGSPFNYNNWMPGQPDFSAHYVSIAFYTGTWETVSGNTGCCFVCQTTKPMSDCLDWKKAGYTDDGFYTIATGGDLAVSMYCDMTTDGGGWTLIQSRVDGSESFWDRKWADYKSGFGYPMTNYWAGNELIHQLTAKDLSVTLRMEMYKDGTPNSAVTNDYWWNDYDQFQVASEADNYRLHLSIDWENVKGNASSGWYDITYSSGAPFSTIDRINDPQPDCITKYQMGGWWLYYCALATLNGAYTPVDWSTGYGIFFVPNGGDEVIHPRTTYMKLRAVK